MIKLLSVAIVAALFWESHQLRLAQPSACWTDWLSSDDPNETGDFETIDGLRQRFPGKICSRPLDIQAQTLSGKCVSKTGDVIFKMDIKEGFICRNQDQCQKGMCENYRVRFRCHPSFCNRGCWTPWFDRDDPTGSGDWETLTYLRRENRGKICNNPTRIQVQTLSGRSVASTGDRIYRNHYRYGFSCRNQDQVGRRMCQDYRVRFWCPAPFSCRGGRVCPTRWFDRDNPSGTGDWEPLNLLRRAYPGQVCAKPLSIEVVTTDTRTPANATGQIFRMMSPKRGFVCRNKDQRRPGRKYCRDYKVRFGCPC